MGRICVAGLGAIVFLALSYQMCSAQAPKEISIPLSAIYGTCRQQEMKQVSGSFRYEGGSKKYDEAFGSDWVAIKKESQATVRNIFLVQGNSIGEAVKASRLVFLEGESADRVARGNKEASAAIWLVCYIGKSGSGRGWDVRSVKRAGNTIRLEFAAIPASTAQIVVDHYYWVPLGELSSGKYWLELYDMDRKDIPIARLVRVP
jgi:hypothetical protein